MKRPKSMRELFSKQERWTVGATFRNRAGEAIDNSSHASSFCLLGGLSYVYGNRVQKRGAALSRLRTAIGLGGGWGVATWNDDVERTFADIQAIVRKARV